MIRLGGGMSHCDGKLSVTHVTWCCKGTQLIVSD